MTTHSTARTIILHIDSSITGENSVSRILSRSIVNQLKELNPGAEIVLRDLATHPLPHFTQDDFADSSVVDEFLAADIVVVGAPMYNFAIPSQLKAWIDRITIAGMTFRYTEQGPEGLTGGKKLVVASSRGGFYGSDTPFAMLDHQESYLRVLFGFLGVTDITFIRAEGTARGAEAREKGIEVALGEISRLAA